MVVYKKPALVVQKSEAENAIRALLSAGLLDATRKITAGHEVHIPVKGDDELAAWAARLGARLVDAELPPREGRISPWQQVVALLPAEIRSLVPDKWEQHEDVLVLRLPDALLPRAHEVGAAFAKALRLKSVLHDPEGVSGEFREMRAQLVYGDDSIATHFENGVRYRFDASRIMFSSGNVAERMRAARLPARGETIVDMFAGIGYFTIPLALYAGAARVHAIEKNPASFKFLVENAKLNGVENVVTPWHGDNREFPLVGIADRVMMGYVGGTRAFLPKAFALLKPEGGMIHLHDTSHADSWKEELTRAVLDAARACGTIVGVEGARVVKSYSPGVVHAVLDVRVRR